jgi:hypothetical protein
VPLNALRRREPGFTGGHGHKIALYFTAGRDLVHG